MLFTSSLLLLRGADTPYRMLTGGVDPAGVRSRSRRKGIFTIEG
jgi:hypothetical protein